MKTARDRKNAEVQSQSASCEITGKCVEAVKIECQKRVQCNDEHETIYKDENIRNKNSADLKGLRNDSTASKNTVNKITSVKTTCRKEESGQVSSAESVQNRVNTFGKARKNEALLTVQIFNSVDRKEKSITTEEDIKQGTVHTSTTGGHYRRSAEKLRTQKDKSTNIYGAVIKVSGKCSRSYSRMRSSDVDDGRDNMAPYKTERTENSAFQTDNSLCTSKQTQLSSSIEKICGRNSSSAKISEDSIASEENHLEDFEEEDVCVDETKSDTINELNFTKEAFDDEENRVLGKKLSCDRIREEHTQFGFCKKSCEKKCASYSTVLEENVSSNLSRVSSSEIAPEAQEKIGNPHVDETVLEYHEFPGEDVKSYMREHVMHPVRLAGTSKTMYKFLCCNISEENVVKDVGANVLNRENTIKRNTRADKTVHRSGQAGTLYKNKIITEKILCPAQASCATRFVENKRRFTCEEAMRNALVRVDGKRKLFASISTRNKLIPVKSKRKYLVIPRSKIPIPLRRRTWRKGTSPCDKFARMCSGQVCHRCVFIAPRLKKSVEQLSNHSFDVVKDSPLSPSNGRKSSSTLDLKTPELNSTEKEADDSINYQVRDGNLNDVINRPRTNITRHQLPATIKSRKMKEIKQRKAIVSRSKENRQIGTDVKEKDLTLSSQRDSKELSSRFSRKTNNTELHSPKERNCRKNAQLQSIGAEEKYSLEEKNEGGGTQLREKENGHTKNEKEMSSEDYFKDESKNNKSCVLRSDVMIKGTSSKSKETVIPTAPKVRKRSTSQNTGKSGFPNQRKCTARPCEVKSAVNNRYEPYDVYSNPSFYEGGRSITTQTYEENETRIPVHYDTWNDPRPCDRTLNTSSTVRRNTDESPGSFQHTNSFNSSVIRGSASNQWLTENSCKGAARQTNCRNRPSVRNNNLPRTAERAAFPWLEENVSSDVSSNSRNMFSNSCYLPRLANSMENSAVSNFQESIAGNCLPCYNFQQQPAINNAFDDYVDCQWNRNDALERCQRLSNICNVNEFNRMFCQCKSTCASTMIINRCYCRQSRFDFGQRITRNYFGYHN